MTLHHYPIHINRCHSLHAKVQKLNDGVVLHRVLINHCKKAFCAGGFFFLMWMPNGRSGEAFEKNWTEAQVDSVPREKLWQHEGFALTYSHDLVHGSTYKLKWRLTTYISFSRTVGGGGLGLEIEAQADFLRVSLLMLIPRWVTRHTTFIRSHNNISTLSPLINDTLPPFKSIDFRCEEPC